MRKIDRYSNIAGVILPFLALIAAILVFWDRGVDWLSLGIFLFMYAISAFGITVGYHRLLTHRSFATHKATAYAIAIAGSLAVEGPVITWVADHRKHHAHTDEEGDPHSPHVGHGSGLSGLYHAHLGWMFVNHGRAKAGKYAPDLLEDRGMRLISSLFPLWLLATLAIPYGLGWAIGGTSDAALMGLLWGGPVRLFFVHHVTWSINSICHFHGLRRFDNDDYSTNVPWLAALSLGEAWHHNHHAFPRSAFHGLKWYEFDPSALVIRGMRRVGLAWNVVEISPERQQEKLAAPSTPAAESRDQRRARRLAAQSSTL
jgi:stearoyl-CoA desaturase (delta-9 desaturase)